MTTPGTDGSAGAVGCEGWPGGATFICPGIVGVRILFRRRLSGQRALPCLGKRGSRVQLGWGQGGISFVCSRLIKDKVKIQEPSQEKEEEEKEERAPEGGAQTNPSHSPLPVLHLHPISAPFHLSLPSWAAFPGSQGCSSGCYFPSGNGKMHLLELLPAWGGLPAPAWVLELLGCGFGVDLEVLCLVPFVLSA